MTTAWPAEVWRTDALRDLDARSRAELEASGALLDRTKGERLFAVGEPADSLFVVLRGEVEVRTGGVTRRAGPGEAVGEDAVARVSGVRTQEAVCATTARLAKVAAHALFRALTRGEGREDEPRLRAWRRAAIVSAMRSMRFAQGLSAQDLGALVDAAAPRTVARGRAVFATGDAAREVLFVADGAVQLEVDGPKGVVTRVGYAGRGEHFGAEDALARAPRAHRAVAAASTWLLAVPLDTFESVALRKGAVAPLATHERQLMGDVFRLEVATSMLVIDEESCVRCGHCASSCASSHEDGLARLVRRGDKVALTIVDRPKLLSLPRSCQHCSEAACMTACPTAAITRNEAGVVEIRESLCTGCGACVKACAWDNVELAPRPDGRAVAVKCDLCVGRSGGPACVSACPVGAIERIAPRAVVAELREANLPLRAMPPATAARWAGGVLGAVAAFLALRGTSAAVSGGALTALMVALAAYTLQKRARLLSALSPHASLHSALGALAVGAFAAHARPGGALGGALLGPMLAALVTGVFGAVAYATLPRALSRLEEAAALPEDLEARRRDAERALLHALSGRSEGQKALFAKVLDPYRRSALGWTVLVASSRTVAAERAHLTARITAVLGARASELGALIDPCVELRSLAARAWLGRALRVWLPLHVASAVVALALAVWHVVVELRYR